MSNIVINSTLTPDGLLFYIESVITSGVSYRWYLNNNLVGLESTYLLTSTVENGYMYCDIDYESESVWYDGQFYGGTFNGNFLGGTFYYGYLNGTYYVEQNKKPKMFTS